MNKTIFQIDYKLSVIIISILGIIIGFVTSAYNVTGMPSFLLYFIKVTILSFLYLIFYLIENKNSDFKEKLKYILGNLLALNGLNITFAVFCAAHILPSLFLTLSGLISLHIIASFVLEIIALYFKNNVIEKIISFNKKIGTVVADPIVRFFDKKITND